MKRRLKPRVLLASTESDRALHQLAGAIALAELDWQQRDAVLNKARAVLKQLAAVCTS